MINISKLYCGLAGQSDDLRYAPSDSTGPVVVYNSTSRCNLKCLHCYSSSNLKSCNDELSTDQAKKLLSDLAAINCPVVLFTGGEPLLRKDLFELLAEAKMLGLRTVLSTNGTLIDSKTASDLAEAGVQYIGISVDGGRDFHDSFRQMKGCFDEAMAALENCKNAGLRTGLRFTITKANADQIPHVFELAASMAVRRICFYHLISVGRAKNLRTQTPTLQQTRTAVDVIMDRTKDYVAKGLLDEVLTVANHADGPYLLLRLKAENNPSFPKAKDLLLTAGGNKIGQNLACVSWNGSVFADQFWRNYSLGNVQEKRFKQIWENTDEPVLNKLRNKGKFADKRCLTCKWFPLCKGNFRFLGSDSEIENWLNEPACYLTDDEIKK